MSYFEDAGRQPAYQMRPCVSYGHRTSAPNDLMSAKKGLSRSLEKVESKSKGILKGFSRDPSVTPPSVIEINPRNVSGYEQRRRKLCRSHPTQKIA